MEECIKEIRSWMQENYLKLNDQKTEFVIFHSRYSQSINEHCEIRIGDETIKPTLTAKNLGVTFDSNMEMKQRISQITSSCYAQMRNISKIRNCLTTDATKQLVNALVTSRLDNANSLLLDYQKLNFRSFN